MIYDDVGNPILGDGVCTGFPSHLGAIEVRVDALAREPGPQLALPARRKPYDPALAFARRPALRNDLVEDRRTEGAAEVVLALAPV